MAARFAIAARYLCRSSRKHPRFAALNSRRNMSSPSQAVVSGATDLTDASAERRVIIASSVGTVFEWYDFYLYAILAPFFAATYVAEHAPDDKRGYNTAWIQTTATLGMFVALLVIGLSRANMEPAKFAAWGWRISFWLSIPLLLISIYIRLKLQESPVFQRM